LIHFLKIEEFPFLQFESAWTLYYLMTGNEQHMKRIVEIGGMLNLVKLLESKDQRISEEVKKLCFFLSILEK